MVLLFLHRGLYCKNLESLWVTLLFYVWPYYLSAWVHVLHSECITISVSPSLLSTPAQIKFVCKEIASTVLLKSDIVFWFRIVLQRHVGLDTQDSALFKIKINVLLDFVFIPYLLSATVKPSRTDVLTSWGRICQFNWRLLLVIY